MADVFEREIRLNPLFLRWVDAGTGSPPPFARLRLENLDDAETTTLQAHASDAGLRLASGRAADGTPVSLIEGAGEAFERFLETAGGSGDEAARAAEVAGLAFARQRAFRSESTVLAEGVVADPNAPGIWGVLNVTPDSFSDGGRFHALEKAKAQAERMAEEGADVIDVGGESTRPGAEAVSAEEELRRVIPPILWIRERLGLPVSVDTSKASVAREALQAGASVVNDVTALSGDPEMAGTIVAGGAGAVLMHMKGTPRTMQKAPRYGDLFGEIARHLRRSLARLASAGGAAALVDPGIGFGKTVDHNLQLVRDLWRLGALGRPALLGPSRKSFIGGVLDLPVDERLEGTAAAVATGVLGGAAVVRVHDVKEMKRVAEMAAALARAGEGDQA